MTSSVAVIILNYRRPQNIGVLARHARDALPDAPIFIYDQGERDDFRTRNDVPWGEVWVQHAETNRGAGARLMVASRMPFDFYLAIDDDTFLTPLQIRRLVERVQAEPDRAHGIAGQRLELHGDRFGWRHGMNRVDAAVSILNQAYAFSRGQAAAALTLAARIGFPHWSDIGALDDVMLSCASRKPPLCHDLGEVEQCGTANERGIASWLADDFWARRVEAAGKLLAIRSIAVFSPLVVQPDPTASAP